MANYYCSTRTNYFKVKDRQSFDAFAKKIGAEVIEGSGGVGLIPRSSDDGGFWTYDPEADEEWNIEDEISKYLADGSIAVVVEAGAEKLRYVHGHAIAIRSDGERVSISLSDIYDLAAQKLGGEVTRAEY